MKHCIILVALLATCTLAGAQERTQLTDSKYDRFGGIYHEYVYSSAPGTPAPRGYKPFYISHIGRHGSRYPVDRGYVTNGMKPLQKCADAGILAPDGERLLRAYSQLDSVSSGVFGHLSPQGALEHKGIAERMYSRTPRVFRQKARDSIMVFSTHRQRCLMSAWNFSVALCSKAPQLHMNLEAGEKYYDILSNAETPELMQNLKPYNLASDRYADSLFNFDYLYSRLFTDPAQARRLISSNRLVAEKIYTNGSVANYLGISDILDLATDSEYELASRNYAGKMYCQHANSAECGDFRTSWARPLLNDFLTRADAAVAGNRVAADLRFTHDTGMMPFFGLIGLEGFDKKYTYNEAAANWDLTHLMCMATNLQAIFYRNRKGHVIVRLLLNEQETSIPAFGPGPYYDWEQLRDYLLKILNKS